MAGSGGGLNLGVPFGLHYDRRRTTPGPPGPEGPQGPPGDRGPEGPAGPAGPPAVTSILTAELPFDGDVLIPPGRLGLILTLPVPAGQWVVTATVGLVNLGQQPHQIDLWVAAVPPPQSIAGPRSSQIVLQPGQYASVTIGPVAATTGITVLSLLGQRDGANPEDQVMATEGTGLVNRSGATAVLALGTTTP